MLSTHELIQALTAGSLLITPHKHLAQVLRENFLKHTALPIQPAPHCLPFQSFLTHCYELLIKQCPHENHPLLLNAYQANALWEASAPKNMAGSTLLAQSVFSAWKLCQVWSVPLEHPSFSMSAQTLLCQDWGHRFEQALAKHHAILSEQLIPYLRPFSLQLPYSRVIFACFDDLNPQQHDLQTYLSKLNLTVDHYDLPAAKHAPQCFPAEDEEAECRALLAWIKKNLEEGRSSIGVIVPHLEKKAPLLKRQLQQHFPDQPVYFSMGQPLSAYPMVAHALEWLSLSSNLTPLQANLLLASPFLIDSDTEKTARLQLLSGLPRSGLSLDEFIQRLRLTCPKLSQFLSELEDYPAQASPSEWAQHLINRLKTCGFPGPMKLSSHAYQTYQRLLDLFHSLASLALIHPTLSRQQALLILHQLAQQTLFQPQQPTKARIHVLGLFEAAGCTYQSLWIMGLTDQQFPAKQAPSPFIPLTLQQAYLLPHTDLSRDHQLAARRFSRFQQASPALMLSYPKKNQDVLNRPSPLLQSIPSYHPPHTPDLAPPSWEYFDDRHLLPFLPTERPHQGSQILAEQAKCPFRAFAAYRLNATPPEETADPYDARARGILLHQTLDKLWQQLKTQAHLHQLSESALHTLIEQSIQQAIDIPHLASLFQSLPPPLQTLEKARLKTLLLASLEWEKTRPAFQIKTIESKHTLSLGPLTFNLRIDRMDQLNNGPLWITDYKTSLPSPLPWNQDAPLEPQLLLYALLDSNVQAILFHELKKGRSVIKGLSATEDEGLSHSKKSWEELREQWRDYLTQLAEDFHQGKCGVKPTQPQVCESCHFQRLCRIE